MTIPDNLWRPGTIYLYAWRERGAKQIRFANAGGQEELRSANAGEREKSFFSGEEGENGLLLGELQIK